MFPGLRVGVGLLAIVLFTLGVPDCGQAAPGDLDPTFGSGGKVTTNLGGDDRVSALALRQHESLTCSNFHHRWTTGLILISYCFKRNSHVAQALLSPKVCEAAGMRQMAQ